MAFDSIDSWLIIAVVAGLLFYGSTKIPQLARNLGRSMGEFKRGRMDSERDLKAPPSGPTPPSITDPPR